jgi:hypothetical protein
VRPTSTGRRSGRDAPRGLLVALGLVLLAGLLAACGGEGVDRALTSSGGQDFKVVEHDGGRYVVGHGITMRLPEDWTDYGPEKDSKDGTSHEWAVGLPADTRPLPVGVQFSMGKDGRGVPFEVLPEATRELARVAPGYRLLDEGEADVPGAEAAAFLRMEKDLVLDGRTHRVEQLQLMLDMPGGQSSVVRFIAEAGRWEEQMRDAYESLLVTEDEPQA